MPDTGGVNFWVALTLTRARKSNALRVTSYDDATAKHATAGAESAAAVLGEIERYNTAKGIKPVGKAW